VKLQYASIKVIYRVVPLDVYATEHKIKSFRTACEISVLAPARDYLCTIDDGIPEGVV